MSFLAGKKALVTGGGRGIGRTIATCLARDGARVAVLGRTEAEINDVATQINGEAVVLDVADRTALQTLQSRLGHIDILVNNAGIAESAAFERTTDEMWDRMFAINVSSAFFLCRTFAPPMVENKWGRIINIASNAGLTGYAYTAAYCASKHAMVGLTRALAIEIARSGVTVNAVCPGWVDTQMTEEAVLRIARKTGRSVDNAKKSLENMSPQGRLIQPEEVAHAVSMLCANEASGIHGQTLVVDGGQVMK